MSKRQDIINAIETRMKTILTTGGYQTNVGQRVHVWRTTTLADTELPALLIYDTTCDINQDGGIIGQFEHRLDVNIELLASGSATRTEVRKMIADVFRAVGTDDNWSGLADRTDMIGHDINLEQAEKLTGAGIVRMAIVYRTARWEI